MFPVAPEDLPAAADAASLSPEARNNRLAEAARFAVLQRLLPVLRHDAAGTMQPVRLLLKVLERRVQMPEPDLPAIVKNVMSVSSLTLQASVDFKNTLGWIATSEDSRVSLRTSVDEAIKMLSLEFSANALELVNRIDDDLATAPQSFLRSVFMGALLAFCDQRAEGGILQVTFEAGDQDGQNPGQLLLRMLSDDTGKLQEGPDIVRNYRLIEWPDVQAMARSFGVKLARGDGWLTLDLPQAQEPPADRGKSVVAQRN